MQKTNGRNEKILKEYERYLTLREVASRGEYLASVKEYLLYLMDQGSGCEETDPGVADEYRAHLLLSERGLYHGTINNKLNRLRSFYRFLLKKRLVPTNPFDWVESVKQGKSLPKNILSVEEMGRLLDGFAVKRDTDLMMRSVVEFLYGSALRISEVSVLKTRDIDFEEGVLYVTDFKRGGERWKCPATEVSFKVARSYMRFSREKLLSEDEVREGYLYPQKGKTALRCMLNRKLLAECRRLGLKMITTHSFRHSAATHVLRSGAGIREVQAFLGHRKITTTERYTRVVKEDLKHVVMSFHPRERETLKR